MKAGRLVLGLVAALAAIVLGARPAVAHSDLEASSPKADSTVTVAPEQVTLTFGEIIRGDFSTVVVTGPDGVTYNDGTAGAVDKTLSQPVKPLVAGQYTVAWRVVSADGHPIQGAFRFTARLPAAEPSPSRSASDPGATDAGRASPGSNGTDAGASSQSPAAAVRENTDEDGTAWLPWAVAGVVGVLALAGAAVLARRRRAT